MSRIHESTSNLQRVRRSQVQPVFFALGNRLLREMQNRGEHHICELSSKSELCGSLPLHVSSNEGKSRRKIQATQRPGSGEDETH